MALDLHKPVSTRLGQQLTQSGFRSNKLMWNYKRGGDIYRAGWKPAKSIDSWQEPTLAEAIDWLSRTLHIIVQIEPILVHQKTMYRAITYDMSTFHNEQQLIIEAVGTRCYNSPRKAIQAAIADILKD